MRLRTIAHLPKNHLPADLAERARRLAVALQLLHDRALDGDSALLSLESDVLDPLIRSLECRRFFAPCRALAASDVNRPDACGPAQGRFPKPERRHLTLTRFSNLPKQERKPWHHETRCSNACSPAA